MEEIKNNAVEKVENAVEDKNQNSTNQESLNQKENSLQQREQERADIRVKTAMMKEHRKAEKQKAKATMQREKQRKKAELKERKTQIKAERKAEKQRLKAKRKEANKGNGGWLAAVISLGVATLVLSSVLTFTFLMPSASDGMLESSYQKSFYSTVEQVDNIDLNLSKALATKDTGALQKYLVDTAINSELAENELQQLPLEDENKFFTTKVVNQIGDYAKYLNNKLIAGQGLDEQDYTSLRTLYKANLQLKQALQDMMQEMGADFSMRSLLNGGKGNTIIHGFNNLQNLSVEYPELIYDGPFSDGQENREIKGLSGVEITSQQATEIFKAIFNDYNLQNVKAVGQTQTGIECFNVQGESKGEILYAQISKTQGEVIMFSYAGSCMGVNCSDDEAVESAQRFLQSLKINDMKPVWINLSNNVYTINFASEQDGVIIYGDLIKVRVCAETCKVIGLEAKSYYTNHTERVISSPVLTESSAQEKVFDGISVKTCRLALVPIGLKSEKLCYEFSGEQEGQTYYVYIDAVTGRQVEMFKVIKSTEGTLLM